MKQEELALTTGDQPQIRYYNAIERAATAVATTPEHKWHYKMTGLEVPARPMQYVVSPEGIFYVFNTLVHSIPLAGGPVQSAGWLTYNDKSPKDLVIDNCSGHYKPNLIQFITTICVLHEAGFLGNEFSIKFSKHTQHDTSIQGALSAFYSAGIEGTSSDVPARVCIADNMILIHISDTINFEAPLRSFIGNPVLYSLTPMKGSLSRSEGSMRSQTPFFTQLANYDYSTDETDSLALSQLSVQPSPTMALNNHDP